MDRDLMPDTHLPWGALEWDKDPPPAKWDHALAALSGHPLQSCLWGDARRAVDGIAQHRWLARRDGEPIWMIRVEERKVLGGKIAWAPRGPTGRTADMSLSVPPGFEERLRAEGFALLVCDPWVAVGDRPATSRNAARHLKPQTIWLDLSVGTDVIFKNCHTQMRKGVRRAARAGIRVETTSDAEPIGEFVALCSSISHAKGFELRLTSALIEFLLQHSASDANVEAAQFVALKEGRVGSGLFVLRVGENVHQIFGATDRNMRQDRVGEACQWAVIEWAIARGCTRYDLEGIDPANNASVYEFKKRLGGEEITLCGHVHVPLNLFGRAMSGLIRFGAKG
jgi:peptidoglycan pentaglycine glycine transferase (the first glycine)